MPPAREIIDPRIEDAWNNYVDEIRHSHNPDPHMIISFDAFKAGWESCRRQTSEYDRDVADFLHVANMRLKDIADLAKFARKLHRRKPDA